MLITQIRDDTFSYKLLHMTYELKSISGEIQPGEVYPSRVYPRMVPQFSAHNSKTTRGSAKVVITETVDEKISHIFRQVTFRPKIDT